MGAARRARRHLALAALAGACALAGGCGQEHFPEGAADAVPPPPRDGVTLGTAVTREQVDDEPEVRRLIERAFASITPENEMKFERVQPERGEWSFAGADALVDVARRAGKRVRGHTLVWHQQLPEWLKERRWSARELEAVLVDHVRTVVSRYRGRVDTWDVVNEPIAADGGWRSSPGSPWLEVLGPRYIEIALRAARAADPEASLFVNELGAEAGGPKLDGLVAMARDLRRRGVPLDGIGLEAHLAAEEAPGRERLEQTIRRLAGLGLDVELTELDVSVAGLRGGDDARLARQAGIYRDAAAACAAVPRCRRVTIWGLSDRFSWLGPDAMALPFDAELRPKPAWDALREGLRR